MTIRSRVSLSLVFLLAAGPAIVAQDDKEPDPFVAEQLATFGKAIKDKKFQRDQEAVAIIDTLLQRLDGMHPKDRKAFLKALQSVFKGRKRKPEQQMLYKASAFALGSFGKEASRTLVSLYDKKPFDDDEWLSFQEILLENIGRTKNPKSVKFLSDRATRDPKDPIKSAAGKALRHYAGAKQDVRKEIVKDLLIDYGKIEGEAKANLNPGDPVVKTRKRTLQAIADPWNTTLTELTGEQFRTAEEWQRWWNKNKNKNWDKDR